MSDSQCLIPSRPPFPFPPPPLPLSRQRLLEKIDDASTELMMGSGDRVMLRLGAALFEATEDAATEFCEAEVERTQARVDALGAEREDILAQQAALKAVLYGRFGRSINLEEK